jgi:hypothetical protein
VAGRGRPDAGQPFGLGLHLRDSFLVLEDLLLEFKQDAVVNCALIGCRWHRGCGDWQGSGDGQSNSWASLQHGGLG